MLGSETILSLSSLYGKDDFNHNNLSCQTFLAIAFSPLKTIKAIA
jgi:hypothetical protein